MNNSISIHTKGVKWFALVFSFLFILSSCKKDKDLVADLSVDKPNVELYSGENLTVQITGGDGTYSASSSAEAIAKPEVSGKSIKINGLSKGTATITVKDGSGRTATVSVTVNNPLAGNTPQFKWTNTVALEQANGWALAVLADQVAVTSLTEKKQFIINWTGGYTVGDKTNAKLRIVESGKTTEEVTLSSLEIQSATENLYRIVFNKDTQKGELVFNK